MHNYLEAPGKNSLPRSFRLLAESSPCSCKIHLLVSCFLAVSQLLETTHIPSKESPHRILVHRYLSNNLHPIKEGSEKTFHIHLWWYCRLFPREKLNPTSIIGIWACGPWRSMIFYFNGWHQPSASQLLIIFSIIKSRNTTFCYLSIMPLGTSRPISCHCRFQWFRHTHSGFFTPKEVIKSF